MDNNRNYFVAIALSVIILIAWQFLYVNPKIERERAAMEAAEQTRPASPGVSGGIEPAPAANVGSDLPDGASLPGDPAGADLEGTPQAAGSPTREAVIARESRVAVRTPSVTGSINLTGARFDDLRLNNYHETVDTDSPLITLLSPAGTERGYFAEFGYIGNALSGEVPGPQTNWQLAEGEALTPETPVVLSWTNDRGLTFTRRISVDDHYMFTVEDAVANAGEDALSLAPYGRVTRFYQPPSQGAFVLHEGLIGVFGEEGLIEVDYDDIEDEGVQSQPSATGGWLGITDKYWATALVPDQNARFDARFAYFADGRTRYQTDFAGEAVTLAPGETQTIENRVFAGAKRVPLVDGYEEQLGIQQFDLLIDWGWFYFITKPTFYVMDFFYRLAGNFGVAILLTTVLVKLIFFPLANKSYVSMARMKHLQPKMMELKERFGDDRMGMQQAMMELYKKEKVNPVAGCWPVLLQIPVFFALYKVIYVTIEMRHAPFFGWIQDLSAPDPTSIFNMFGLLPYDVPAALSIGIWPLIMGLTMFLQMRMNPTPPDPTQAMIFNWMPVVFTFMLAQFPAGLVIYWAWNNTLSILQQGIIMKRQGTKIELWDNLIGLFRKKKPDPAE